MFFPYGNTQQNSCISIFHVYPEIHLEIEYFHNYGMNARFGSSHYYCCFPIAKCFVLMKFGES